ncbi:hypothetical protein ACOME3_010176 [Neoechinorhynchus agilis]
MNALNRKTLNVERICCNLQLDGNPINEIDCTFFCFIKKQVPRIYCTTTIVSLQSLTGSKDAGVQAVEALSRIEKLGDRIKLDISRNVPQSCSCSILNYIHLLISRSQNATRCIVHQQLSDDLRRNRSTVTSISLVDPTMCPPNDQQQTIPCKCESVRRKSKANESCPLFQYSAKTQLDEFIDSKLHVKELIQRRSHPYAGGISSPGCNILAEGCCHAIILRGNPHTSSNITHQVLRRLSYGSQISAPKETKLI